MTFLDLAVKRCSIRDYAQTPVEEDRLAVVLEAARLAPSAANFQPLAIVVIREENNRARFKEVYAKEWFHSAPVIIAVSLDRNAQWNRSDGKAFGDIDAAITMDHITLAAADFGLGTCWVGNFNRQRACELLELPEWFEPIAFTPLGYPKGSPRPKKRKPLEELVCWERFGGKREV